MTDSQVGHAPPSLSPSHTEYVLAWDIEKSGPRTDKHSMLAIGAVVVRVIDDQEVSKFRVFMKMEEGHDFSEHCRADYWYNFEKNPNNKRVLKLIETEGIPPSDGIRKFADWLDEQERTYTSLAPTTDNPSSDAAWVSHYFQKYLDRHPMIHREGKEPLYRRLHHSNEYARAISLDDGSGGDWCQRLREMGIKVPPKELHDHDPLNDARWIALLYTACIRYTHATRKRWEQARKNGQGLAGLIHNGRPLAPPGVFTIPRGDERDVFPSIVPVWNRPKTAPHQIQQQAHGSPLRHSDKKRHRPWDKESGSKSD